MEIDYKASVLCSLNCTRFKTCILQEKLQLIRSISTLNCAALKCATLSVTPHRNRYMHIAWEGRTVWSKGTHKSKWKVFLMVKHSHNIEGLEACIKRANKSFKWALGCCTAHLQMKPTHKSQLKCRAGDVPTGIFTCISHEKVGLSGASPLQQYLKWKMFLMVKHSHNIEGLEACIKHANKSFKWARLWSHLYVKPSYKRHLKPMYSFGK